MKTYYFLLLIIACSFQTYAQKKNETFRLNIRKTTIPIIIDGIANDQAWQDTDVADDFFMVLPQDTGKAIQHSEIRMTYDNKYIYLVATFYNNIPGPYYVESLRRDFSFGNNDNFLFFTDGIACRSVIW